MKQKKINKKLVLKKQLISQLNKNEMFFGRGGRTDTCRGCDSGAVTYCRPGCSNYNCSNYCPPGPQG